MRLTGRLLKIEDKPYSFTENGTTNEGTSTFLHVLEDVTVHRVKVPKDSLAKIAHFEHGDELDLIVNVQANAGARGAYLTVTFAGEFAPATSPALSAVESF